MAGAWHELAPAMPIEEAIYRTVIDLVSNPSFKCLLDLCCRGNLARRLHLLRLPGLDEGIVDDEPPLPTKARGSGLSRCLTSSIERWAAARVTLATNS